MKDRLYSLDVLRGLDMMLLMFAAMTLCSATQNVKAAMNV